MTTPALCDAIIIGGGLAGAGTAYALARRSLKTVLCETYPHLAAKASGNAHGLLMPYVATSSSPQGRLYARGFSFTRHMLLNEFNHLNLYTECGAIQLPSTKRLSRILTESGNGVGDVPIQKISAAEGSEISGVTIQSPGFFIPRAGYCRPADITHTLAHNAGSSISIKLSSRALALVWANGHWTVTTETGDQISAPNVILCGAHEASTFEVSRWLPLEAVRGQTVHIQASHDSHSLRTVISYDGYVTPQVEGHHFVGANYRHNDMNDSPCENDSTEIITRLLRSLPTLGASHVTASRVCFRASTHDRIPYIGELPLLEGTRLFCNAGHGSRGLVTAPLGGELIARLITNEPLGDLQEAATIMATARLAKRFEQVMRP